MESSTNPQKFNFDIIYKPVINYDFKLYTEMEDFKYFKYHVKKEFVKNNYNTLHEAFLYLKTCAHHVVGYYQEMNYEQGIYTIPREYGIDAIVGLTSDTDVEIKITTCDDTLIPFTKLKSNIPLSFGKYSITYYKNCANYENMIPLTQQLFITVSNKCTIKYHVLMFHADFFKLKIKQFNVFDKIVNFNVQETKGYCNYIIDDPGPISDERKHDYIPMNLEITV